MKLSVQKRIAKEVTNARLENIGFQISPSTSFLEVDRVLHAARTWRRRLQSEAEQTSAIGALVDRVELKSNDIRVSIMLPVAGAEKSRAQLPDQVLIARSFPMQLKRRGVELRLIVGDHDRSAAIVDLSLVKAVARAHRWFDEISCHYRKPRLG